ncbi:MAG: polysaccharide deacetylase family protein [Acidobacteriota bacterium]
MNRRRFAVRMVSGLARASGWTSLVRRRRHRQGDYRLYVLEYHEVSDDPTEVSEDPTEVSEDPTEVSENPTEVSEDLKEPEGAVSMARFAGHLRHLQRRFEIVPLAAAVDRLTAGHLDRDLLTVTFDDGYAGNYEAAWPALRDAGVPATIFLTTGFLDGEGIWVDFARRALAAVGRQSQALADGFVEDLRQALGSWSATESIDTVVRRLKYLPPKRRQRALRALRQADLDLAPAARPLSWDQVREMQAGGIEFGAHTVTHPILSTLEPTAQESEIRRSRRRIAEATGHEPTTFAYPNGSAKDYDRHTLEIIGHLGFAAACTTRRGSNRSGCDLRTLQRLGIGSDSLAVVEARLAGLFDEAMRARLRR